MWIWLEEHMNKYNSVEINFNTKNVICNSLVEDLKNVRNYICLLFKQYLYRQRCFAQKPNRTEFSQLVWKTRAVEKYITEKNNLTDKFAAKWCTKE